MGRKDRKKKSGEEENEESKGQKEEKVDVKADMDDEAPPPLEPVGETPKETHKEKEGEGTTPATGTTGETPADDEFRIRPHDKMMCLYSEDNKLHAVTVISSRPAQDGKEGLDWYIHWDEFNKRLDCWKHESELSWPEGGPKRPKHSHSGSQSSHSRRRDRDGNRGDDDGDTEQLTAQERLHEEITKVRNIQQIQLGKYLIDAWYFSPYPEEFANCGRLYICDFCFKYMKSAKTLQRHYRKCTMRHPPGNEIYRDGKLSFWEVDGKRCRVYCQNLCLIAKLFLDHKTLYYDVEPFMFYILTEVDSSGCHLIGYFSKEKDSPDGYNLACICTLPCFQKRGYGKYLIQFCLFLK